MRFSFISLLTLAGLAAAQSHFNVSSSSVVSPTGSIPETSDSVTTILSSASPDSSSTALLTITSSRFLSNTTITPTSLTTATEPFPSTTDEPTPTKTQVTTSPSSSSNHGALYTANSFGAFVLAVGVMAAGQIV